MSAAVGVCAFDASATAARIVAEAETALRRARRGARRRGLRRVLMRHKNRGRRGRWSGAMDVERHHAIAPLLAEWAALHAADDRATPYGSAAWARAAVEHGMRRRRAVGA